MKKLVLSLISILFLFSCSSVKRGKQALNQGNYTEAMHIALEKLQKDKTKKSNQEHVLILQDAFHKYVESSHRRIRFLEKEDQLSNAEEIFTRYTQLEQTQNRIAPLLPLYAGDKLREVRFRFKDYSDLILESKGRFSEYLYQEALLRMESRNKAEIREAYALLQELKGLAPHYKNSDELLEESRAMGIHYVLVGIRNESESILPQDLEEELLNFRTYGLDDFWTRYHTAPITGTRYDFGVDLHFKDILVSPERVLEREIPLEGEVLDRLTYKKDRQGNYLLDSLGQKIKVEHFVKVKGTLIKTIQTKRVAVQAQVDFIDFNTEQLLGSHPVNTEFYFENAFAVYEGDERLLEEADKALLLNGFVPFPSDEQMLMDASGDIKARVKPVLKSGLN